MKRSSLMVPVLAMGLLATACGSEGGSLGPGPTGEPTPAPGTPSPTGPAPSPTVQPTGSPTESPSPAQPFSFQVWFERDGRLFVTQRTEPFEPAVAALALEGLAAGPTGPERAAGVDSAVPAGTTFAITDLAGGVATLEMDDAFFDAADATVRLREAQVVFTLTQYPTIESVAFGGTAGAVDRATYEDLLPAITVESPLIGATVSNPVTVSGTANVFEATVSLRILDADGKEIARTFTTATCGTGCRGEYTVSVSYAVGSQQRGTVEVFESSAKDGSAVNVVSIPVTLTP